MAKFRWCVVAAAALGCSSGAGDGSAGPPGVNANGGAANMGGASATGGGGPGVGGDGAGGGVQASANVFPASGRRLTRDELFNTLGDLLAVDTEPLRAIVKEDKGADGGFRTWRSALLPSGARTDAFEQAAVHVAKAISPETLAKFASCQDMTPECKSGYVGSIGRLLYRRPLTELEVTRLAGLFDIAASKGDGFEMGARLVVQAMLQSVHFLYRVERADRIDPVTQLAQVDPYELASRWSFLFWQAAPDAQLLDLAAQGALNEVTIAEMLQSPKARRGARAFFDEWLGTYKLETRVLDTKLYPAFSPELTQEMREESLDFFEKLVFDERGSFLSAFTRQSSTVGPKLATLYGGAAAGEQDWSTNDTRGGFLTQAGIIMAHTKVEETSIVDRGLFVLRSLMCMDVPAAPPGAAARFAEVDIKLPQRVRFEQHRKDPACTGCHSAFDTLGNPFEAYSALGEFKTVDHHNNPIEVGGTFMLDGVSHTYKNLEEFASILSQSPQIEQCMVRQLLSYAFGRGLEKDDEVFVSALTTSFEERTHDFLSLFQDLALSQAYKNVPQEAAPTTGAQETP